MNNDRMDMPMKWHNFLIYFSLWAGAVLNIIGAYSTYSQDSNYLHAFFEKLKVVDILYIVAAIIIAVFLIYTRFQLAGFKVGAPKKLTLCYVLSIIVSLGYVLGVSSATGINLSDLNLGNTIVSVITGIVMIIINNIYYGKRASMFVN